MRFSSIESQSIRYVLFRLETFYHCRRQRTPHSEQVDVQILSTFKSSLFLIKLFRLVCKMTWSLILFTSHTHTHTHHLLCFFFYVEFIRSVAVRWLLRSRLSKTWTLKGSSNYLFYFCRAVFGYTLHLFLQGFYHIIILRIIWLAWLCNHLVSRISFLRFVSFSFCFFF